MSEMENKLNVEDLEQVTGGVGRQEKADRKSE